MAPDGGERRLEQALDRNVFSESESSPEVLAGLARYLRGEVETLAAQSYQELAAGRLRFDPPALTPARPVKAATANE